MKSLKDQKGGTSGAVLLTGVKVLAVVFALSLFSAAVWFRHRLHNPLVESESAFTENSGSVSSEAELPGKRSPRIGASSSKQAHILPSDWTFHQPGTETTTQGPTIDPKPKPSPEVVEFEGFLNYGDPIRIPELDSEPTKSVILAPSSKAIAMPIFSTKIPPKTADKRENRVLMSSSKLGVLVRPAQWSIIMPDESSSELPSEIIEWDDPEPALPDFESEDAGNSRWQPILEWDDLDDAGPAADSVRGEKVPASHGKVPAGAEKAVGREKVSASANLPSTPRWSRFPFNRRLMRNQSSSFSASCLLPCCLPRPD